MLVERYHMNPDTSCQKFCRILDKRLASHKTILKLQLKNYIQIQQFGYPEYLDGLYVIFSCFCFARQLQRSDSNLRQFHIH
jgi:hypothetical protein